MNKYSKNNKRMRKVNNHNNNLLKKKIFQREEALLEVLQEVIQVHINKYQFRLNVKII